MSVETLGVGYVDTCADQLTLSIGDAELPALARQDWSVGSTTVTLALLGASHQVLVRGDVEFTETLACRPDRPAFLPPRYDDHPTYSFTSHIHTLSDDELRETVESLTARVDAATLAGEPALCGRFPKHPLAVTAVFAQLNSDLLTWETWHTYPQHGEAVVTKSELRCAP